MTKDEAVALHNSEFWKQMSFRDRAVFQMFEDRLCMPFAVFHEAISKALGRDVYTHEFGLNKAGLQRELMGECAAPTFEEIVALIPADKRVVLATKAAKAGEA